MNTIESWSLSDGERREIARKYCARIVDARINNSISEMPSDAWLNAELRERGCPDAMLERWRKRIRATPLHYISDVAMPAMRPLTERPRRSPQARAASPHRRS
jgi:hypothetical protein